MAGGEKADRIESLRLGLGLASACHNVTFASGLPVIRRLGRCDARELAAISEAGSRVLLSYWHLPCWNKRPGPGTMSYAHAVRATSIEREDRSCGRGRVRQSAEKAGANGKTHGRGANGRCVARLALIGWGVGRAVKTLDGISRLTAMADWREPTGVNSED